MSAFPPASSMPFFSASARVLMWPYMEYCLSIISKIDHGDLIRRELTKTIATLGAMTAVFVRERLNKDLRVCVRRMRVM